MFRLYGFWTFRRQWSHHCPLRTFSTPPFPFPLSMRKHRFVPLDDIQKHFKHIEEESKTLNEQSWKTECMLPAHLYSKMRSFGFTRPTPMQAKVMRFIIHGDNNVFVQQETGAGKTLIFTMPVLSRVDNYTKETQALIIAPTRELCIQLQRVIKKLNTGGSKKRKENPITIARVPGKVDKTLINFIKTTKPHVLIGIPSTIRMLLNEAAFSLATVTQVVLDEADGLLRNEYIKETMSIVAAVHKTKHARLICVGATLDPVKAAFLNHDGGAKSLFMSPNQILLLPESATQNEHKKFSNDNLEPLSGLQVLPSSLQHLLIENLPHDNNPANKAAAITKCHAALRPRGAILIFVNDAADIEPLREALKLRNFNVGVLDRFHSTNESRSKVFRNLRNGELRYVIATDFVARGIDFECNLSMVMNLDAPTSALKYIHRAGRLSRLGDSEGSLVVNFRHTPDYLLQALSSNCHIQFLRYRIESGALVDSHALTF